VVSGVRRMNEVNPRRARLVPGWVTVFGRVYQLSLSSLRVAYSSTSFGWGRGGNATPDGWQVTLCDLIWYVCSRSGEACCELLHTLVK